MKKYTDFWMTLTQNDPSSFDFSWIGEEVSKWLPELRTPDNAKRMMPSRIFWWVDLTGGVPQTHLGEPIYDFDEYWRLREEWIDKNIKGL